MMRKGVFALLATYVVMEVLVRTSFVAGFAAGAACAAVVAWLW